MSEAENEAKQGSADGLCGIYCLINHMRNWGLQTEKSNENEALRYLLQSAQVLGFLDPNRLVNGFEAFELRLIFNQVAEWHQKLTRAYHIELLGDIPLLDACKSVFKAGGEAVISETDGSHWVLAIESEKAGLKVLDSGRSANKGKFLKSTTMMKSHGLALLPLGSVLVGQLGDKPLSIQRQEI